MKVSTLVQSFYNKAAQRGSRLDFMLKLGDSTGIEISPSEEQVNLFLRRTNNMEVEITDLLLHKLPKNMEIYGINARRYLQNQMKTSNNQLKNIINLSRIIRLEIGDIVINNNNQHFYAQFKQWYGNPISIPHLISVENEVASMLPTHITYKEKFEQELGKVEIVKENLKRITESANLLFIELLVATTTEEIREAVILVTQKSNEAINQQASMLDIYKNLHRIVIEYNKKRTEWAGILIKYTGEN